MNRIRLVFLAPLIALGALAATPAPDHADVTLANLQGQQKRFADYRGKVLVVNFWATWCVPCQHEMPLFMDAQKKYGDDRIQVVAVSVDDATTREKIPGFVEKRKLSLPVLIGGTETMQKLGLGEAVPATAFIDKDGKIVARILGEVSKSELKRQLEWMLGSKSGEPPPELINNLNKKRDSEMSVPGLH
jgi:thiol-disulfide isomerase/thioredoxin